MDFAYPRPQLERNDWMSLNGHWRFTYDDERRYSAPTDITAWPLDILVPFPPESTTSGIGDRGFHSACCYQRDFELMPGDDRVIVHFGAVDYLAKVWVNGGLAVTHEGGHTPFAADITDLLDASGVQTITVYAFDDPHDLTKPRGKQDWQLEPHSIWYPRTTGIWQTVWIERVARAYIGKIRWTPHVEGFAIGFEARIVGDPVADLTLTVTLRHGERLLASDSYRVIDGEVDRAIALSDPGIDDYRNEVLWSPERPTLIDATIQLLRAGEVIDECKSYTALRSVKLLRDRFMLNGRPYTLRMVLDQGYWPDTLLAAPSDEALRRDVELAKAMGFNGVRKHQKFENPRYLYWADRLGLLVWAEMPSAYRFTRTAIRRTVREWTEVIERDYSHPCVIVWVPFNESWGVPELTAAQGVQRHAVEALYHLTKTLDATRPVIGNDGWESSATDIIGIHDYDPKPEHMRQHYGRRVQPDELFDRRRPGGRVLTLEGYSHRGRPIMLTEFGGIAIGKPQPAVEHEVPVDHKTPTGQPVWGYSTARNEAEFARLYQELLYAVIHINLFSGFCYTQFCDTFQEGNGLLYADRTPKVPLDVIARATTVSPTRADGFYEPGVFDIRAPEPRPTAMVELLRDLARSGHCDHPVLDSPGWWARRDRLHYPPVRCKRPSPLAAACAMTGKRRSLIIVGAHGTLGQALAGACDRRALPYHLLGRDTFDIADDAAVARVLTEVQPWAVINAAGCVDVDRAESDVARCWRDNCTGPERLADACAARGIALVTFSSDLVFDGAKPGPYLEIDAVAPLNVYGQSKASAERSVLVRHPKTLVVRTSAFFGPSDRYNFATQTLARLRAGDPIAAVDAVAVSPTYIPDLVDHTLDLLIDGETGIWHLANRGRISWYEFARELAGASGMNHRLIHAAAPAEAGWIAARPSNSTLASSRGSVMPGFECALGRFLDAVRGRGERPVLARAS